MLKNKIFSQGSRTPFFIELNFIIFIWGFTSILRKYIELSPEVLTIYRTLITFISLAFYMYIRKKDFSVSPKMFLLLLLAGGVIGVHWAIFFKAIDESNISISVAMLSTGAIFASFLEPIVFRRKLRLYEVLFGLLASIGVCVIIFSEDFFSNPQYLKGAVLALIASFLSACYSMINAKFSHRFPDRSTMISCYEMLGAAIIVSLLWSASEGFFDKMTQINTESFILTFILAIFATSYTSVAIIRLFKNLSPFTVLLNINLEPVYSMILAVILFPSTEIMSARFYLGAGIILFSVVANALMSKKINQRRKDY